MRNLCRAAALMMMFLLFLVYWISTARAQYDPLERKVDGHVYYNSGRAADFPSGQERMSLTVILGDDWQSDPRQRTVASWFKGHRRLQQIKQKCWSYDYERSNPMYKERLEGHLGAAFPIVCLQAPDGRLLANITAVSMPTDPDELADMLDDAAETYVNASSPFAGQCVGPNCVPPQQNQPNSVLPEVLPARRDKQLLIMFMLFIAVGVVVVVAVKRGERSAVQPNSIF